MANINHLPNDVRAFIYQNTNDLEKNLLPGSQLSVVLVDTANQEKFKVKFTLKTNEFAVDAVGTADNPFDAVKEAKEKMSTFLGDVNRQMAEFKTIEKPLVLH
jgi:ribosome-associated translation inhibitor RaiA